MLLMNSPGQQQRNDELTSLAHMLRVTSPQGRRVEQRKALEAHRKACAWAREKERARRREKERALLCEHLSPKQLIDWRRCRRFTVHGSHGNVYIVSESRFDRRKERYKKDNFRWPLHRNVAVLKAAGEKLYTFESGWLLNVYIQHQIDVPHADDLLAKKLLLETDELAFQRMACIERATWTNA